MDNKTMTELLNILHKKKKEKTKTVILNDQTKKDDSTIIDQINPLNDNFNLFKIIDIITIIGNIYSICATILLIYNGERLITQNIYYYLGVLVVSLISILF